ncbi:hypothetical protein LIT25_26960 (plasmid) [Bacillus sp. F19]|nr:hypothetical protein LIT25_26960 [Bacillus sp. F19]
MTIRYEESAKIFHLKTRSSSYLFGLNRKKGYITCIGEKIRSEDCEFLLKTYAHSSFDPEVKREREEFSPWGGFCYIEPTLKVKFHDNVRDLQLDFEYFEIRQENEVDILSIHLILKSYITL